MRARLIWGRISELAEFYRSYVCSESTNSESGVWVWGFWLQDSGFSNKDEKCPLAARCLGRLYSS